MVDIKKTAETPNASTKGVTCLAIMYDNGTSTNEKTGKTAQWVDVQAAQFEGANPQLAPQTQPHLNLRDSKSGKGKDSATPYFEGQIESMVKAAGDNVQELRSQTTNEVIGKALVFNGNIRFGKDGKPTIVDTRNLESAPEGLVIPDNVANAQFEAVDKNRTVAKEAKAAKAAAPEAEAPEAATAAPEKSDEPSFG